VKIKVCPPAVVWQQTQNTTAGHHCWSAGSFDCSPCCERLRSMGVCVDAPEKLQISFRKTGLAEWSWVCPVSRFCWWSRAWQAWWYCRQRSASAPGRDQPIPASPPGQEARNHADLAQTADQLQQGSNADVAGTSRERGVVLGRSAEQLQIGLPQQWRLLMAQIK
jgi:hypothetical protein